MEIAVPRDRDGSFEPQLIKKGQRRFEGFDDKIISMYARGMDRPGNPRSFERSYAVEVSPRPDLPGHRCRLGGGPGMAKPAPGPGLPPW